MVAVKKVVATAVGWATVERKYGKKSRPGTSDGRRCRLVKERAWEGLPPPALGVKGL